MSAGTDFWRDRPVLVTGAGGFIGSHLVERLAGLGAAVRAFVRYTSRGQAGFLDAIDADLRDAVDVVRGDLRDSDAVADAVRNVNLVFHLGALIGIPYSYVHPRETAETNLLGTLNILTATAGGDVEAVVCASSSEVYGTARYVPIDEDHPLQAQSPYSASKIGADKLAESFFDSYGLPVVIVRPFNTYGPRQSARAVIPTIIQQGLVGDEVRLGNLKPRRDFTYVDDTVDGFVKAAETKAAVGRAINLGTSTEISVEGLVEKIGVILGRPLTVVHEPHRGRLATSEVDRLCSDNRLARELLGWAPTVSLDEGLQRTVAWMAENAELTQAERYEV